MHTEEHVSAAYTFDLLNCPPAEAIAGGKGASLATLAKAGLPVPQAFVVTTYAYRRFVTENGIEQDLASILGGVADEDGTAETWNNLRRVFDQGTLPRDVAADIARCYESLGGTGVPVAIRSSATVEDLADTSSAGQHETYLNVVGYEPAMAAIKRCWSSLWTPHALSYRSQQGIPSKDLSIAVVVQVLIPADSSGVLFTADPVSSRRDVVAISASWGLGSAVVGGLVSADYVVLQKSDGRVLKRQIEDKRLMTVTTEDGTEERPVPESLRREPVLTQEQINELTRIGLEIEDLYGVPVDIEWALSKGRVFILQARPITTANAQTESPLASGDPFQWNDSLERGCLWSNVNFGEGIPEVMTPLTWSVVRFAIEDWVFIPGQPTVGNIGGRPYMNISVFASIMYALGKDRQGFLDAMEPVLYLSLPNDLDIPTISLSRLSLLRAIGTYLKVQYEQWRGWRRLQTYLADNKQWFALVRKRIDSETSGTALADFFEKEMALHIKAGAWSVLGCVSRSSVWMTRLRKDLTKVIGPEDAHYLIGNVGERSGFLASLAPMKGLSDIKEKRTTKEQYLMEYGHRGPEEFELSVPRPAEDSSWLDRRLEDYTEHPVDIAGLMGIQRDNYARAWQHLTSSQPSQARSFSRRITRNAELAGLREEARSVYVRDRWSVRLFALRAGALTGLGDDIFFLTLQEVLMLLKGTGDHTRFIEERKACYRRFKSLPPYPSLIRGRFDPSAWATDPERAPDLFDSFSTNPDSKARVAETNAADGEIVRGSAGSAGIVRGRVRKLSHPDEGRQLQTGEILVTTATDIAWTLIFPRLAAVVTDVGAPLSHAAIVARELGIPAVVGCGNATARLSTGDLVLVDGSQGTVQLIEKARG